MVFAFNENGCKAIIDFYGKLLERVLIEVAFLERERDAALELEARFAIEEALAKSQFDRAKIEIKLREMEQYLKTSQQA